MSNITIVTAPGTTPTKIIASGGSAVDVGQILGSQLSSVTVGNTTSEGALVNLTLPGGLVKAGDALRVVALLDQKNDSGSSITHLFKLKFGSTVVLATAAGSISTSTQRREMMLVAEIVMVNTTAQRVGAVLHSGGAGSENWGQGAIGFPFGLCGYGTAAEDTASDKAVQLTLQMGTANANTEVVCYAAYVQHIRARLA